VAKKETSISVVIPAFNERKTIREIVRRVKATPREKEIIIVDDCSTDGTRQILREFDGDPEVKVILQMRNGGKGNALKVGFQAATKDVIIVQDADLEYDPDDYETLLRPIDLGRADVVYGSRFLHGERRVLYFKHSLGNRFLTLLSNLFTDLNLTDMETCYKVFKREILQNIELRSERFGFEPEITAKVAKLKCAVYEVPIRYYGRSYAEGKKITWRDGVAALFHIVRFSLGDNDFVKDQAAINKVLVSPPVDPDVGVDTLEAFEDAKRYNAWICERIDSAIGERVLEVGSGIGNIVAEVLGKDRVRSVVATDLSESSLATLHDRLGDDGRLSTQVWNAEDPPPEALLRDKFDTIICSNVLEHIKDHDTAVVHMRQLLKPDGNLVILVPANPAIFNGMDEDLGHFRRYTRVELNRVLTDNGMNVRDMIDHNLVGAVGWWWAGCVRKRRTIRVKDTRTFEKLVPFLKPIDSVLTKPFGGVSLIAISTPRKGEAVGELASQNA
jgi:SAM-dependent methyltransferase